MPHVADADPNRSGPLTLRPSSTTTVSYGRLIDRHDDLVVSVETGAADQSFLSSFGSVCLGGQAGGVRPVPRARHMRLYVGFDQGALALVDPVTLQITKSVRIDVQDAVGGLAYGFGSIWFPTFGNDTVLRLKPLR